MKFDFTAPKNDHILIQVSPETRKKLEKIANKHGISLGKVAATIVETASKEIKIGYRLGSKNKPKPEKPQ